MTKIWKPESIWLSGKKNTQQAQGKLNAKPALEKSRGAPQFTFCSLKWLQNQQKWMKVGLKAGLVESIFKKAVNSQISSFPATSSSLRFRPIFIHRTPKTTAWHQVLVLQKDKDKDSMLAWGTLSSEGVYTAHQGPFLDPVRERDHVNKYRNHPGLGKLHAPQEPGAYFNSQWV